MQSQDRNLPASQQKLQKARSEGQVARSRELNHAAVLGVGSLALIGLLPWAMDLLKPVLRQQFIFESTSILQPQGMLDSLQQLSDTALLLCVPLGLIILLAAVGAALLSGGWVSSLKPLEPDWSRINPGAGLLRLFGKERLTETIKLCGVTLLLLGGGAWYVHTSFQTLIAIMLQPGPAALIELGSWLNQGVNCLLLILLAVALLDLPLQQYLHRSRLKMSIQEVKQEFKESDGNPHIKSQRLAKHRRLAELNSVNAVSKADFVLTNPSHYAVALRYDDQTMAVPRVIAKGTDLLALKIREIALSRSIPVLQSPKLARALYAHVAIEQDIPSKLYPAVAQVLAHVYRLKAAWRGEANMPDAMGEPMVPDELDPHVVGKAL